MQRDPISTWPITEAEPSGFLAVVEAHCGAGAVERLCAEFGGERISLPANPRPGHRLCRVLGLEATQQIVAEFGHGAVDVPLGPQAQNVRRLRATAVMIRDGKSTASIARSLGCSSRSVLRYRRRLQASGVLP